jgi:RND family efflux transporter MFP subunit
MQRITILCGMLLLLASSCQHAPSDTASEALPVEVAYPLVKEVTLTQQYPGYLAAEATIALVGRVNGTLQQSLAKEGSRVRKGDLLFVIDPTLYEDAVKQADASLRTAQATLAYNRSNYERMQEALKSDAVSRIEVLQAEANVKESEASVDNALAALETARTQLGYCYVKAPCDGLLSLFTYSVGSYVAGGSSPVTLATIYNDRTMTAYFNLSDNRWLAHWLQQSPADRQTLFGEQITIQRDEERDTFEGRIVYLSPNVTLATGTVQLKAKLNNPNGVLKSGTYVHITLPYEEVPNAVLVRDAAIGTDQLGKYLYVVNDSNRVEYRPIRTGQLVDDSLRLVTDGLSPRERYVTQALLKVRDGMSITPILPSNPSK